MSLTSYIFAFLSSGLVLLGTLVGYQLAGKNESNRDQRTMERENEARRDIKIESREIDWHNFQMTTLLELQGALLELTRATSMVLTADERSLRTSSQYSLLGEGLTEPARSAHQNLIRLMNRVTNEELRASLTKFNSRTTAMVVISLSPITNLNEEIKNLVSHRTELSHLFEEVNEKLGVILREIILWNQSD